MRHYREDRSLYFAYGSNLYKPQIIERCPKAIPLRQFELRGWTLVFRLVADIAPSFGGVVQGALYSVTDSDIDALDEFEGVANGKYRRTTIGIASDNYAQTYVMNNQRELECPSNSYYQIIVYGYCDWGLPIASLIAARHRSIRNSSIHN